MNCLEAEKLMSLRLDGELDASRGRALDEHLLACPQCPRQWQRLQRMAGLLAEWPTPAVPATLKERVIAASSRPTATARARRRVNLRLPTAVLACAAAAAAVLFVIFGLPSTPTCTLKQPTAEYVMEVSPLLPPEIVDALAKLPPSAGDDLMGLGRQAASAIEKRSATLTERTSKLHGRVQQASNRFLKGYFEHMEKSVDRTFERFRGHKEDNDDAPIRGALPPEDSAHTLVACPSPLRPAVLTAQKGTS